MKILIDLNHPAHINFFKTFIRNFRCSDDVILSYLDRGKIKQIVQDEFPDLVAVKAGRHRGTKFSIILEANILKFFKLLFLVITKKVDLGLSCGSFTLGMAMKLAGKPNLQFDDDPERGINLFLEKLTATKLMIPFFYTDIDVEKFDSLKEWAYLSPRYFEPKMSVLKKYNLVKKKYIFVREVSNKTFNYMNQRSNPIAAYARGYNPKIPVILSLEDKKTASLYPPHWQIIEEPEAEIHSLMYYSLVVVSSGDSMAREGAMLGVPAIYCGDRKMAANFVMSELGLLWESVPDEVPTLINDFVNDRISYPIQEEFRSHLKTKWGDVNNTISNFIETKRKI